MRLICSVPGCGRDVKVKRMCRRHYHLAWCRKNGRREGRWPEKREAEDSRSIELKKLGDALKNCAMPLSARMRLQRMYDKAILEVDPKASAPLSFQKRKICVKRKLT